jgi:hypothetical protein
MQGVEGKNIRVIDELPELDTNAYNVPPSLTKSVIPRG